ncbi:hypothetical protein F4677DRAFT_463260 [Hypoxylon crocopeplum]|nr:hypothetical protein F4677DRAFT_463260 [Hypoxylon crocopeplum]
MPRFAYYRPEHSRLHRLLSDIRELVEKPYPNITLCAHDSDLSSACLILTPTHYTPLHLTIKFTPFYPTEPPVVEMNSYVIYPNVTGRYICDCLGILSNEHTPAITLKGIAIQLLSFFSSDSLDQEKVKKVLFGDKVVYDTFKCSRCRFGHAEEIDDARWLTLQGWSWPKLQGYGLPTLRGSTELSSTDRMQDTLPILRHNNSIPCHISRLPNEILLMILEELDSEEMTHFAAACPRISDVIRDFNLVRQRELQCFCLKQDYRSVNIGVGVSIKRGQIASEFDFLSQEAFNGWGIFQAVNLNYFNHWLPLPISRPHWSRVKNHVRTALGAMQYHLKKDRQFGEAQVIFMNDVVVQLNKVADDIGSRVCPQKSNLRHASEKAIKSYFHLFHLLVCLATENAYIVWKDNTCLQNFIDGEQSKTSCPNIGHLLIALLISNIEVTETLMKAIIIETITRNVVWLFDPKGANMPQLSFMESDPVSTYRLEKTFEGSRTSYRLLMFSELFRRTARPSHKKPLSQVRDELFDRYGAPPNNAAQELAMSVRRIHTINDFPAFMREMGIKEEDPHMSMNAEDARWVKEN